MAIKTLQEINNEFMLAREESTQIRESTKKKRTAFAGWIAKKKKSVFVASAERKTRAALAADTKKKKRATLAADTKKKKRTAFAVLADMLFYLAIIAIFFTLLSPGTDSGRPRSILGYSYFTVVSNSMKDEIPKGSFVLVRETPPHELMEGDNITFMRGRYDPVTHQIIAIYENYDSSGARGFVTMGTNNLHPDDDIVYEANVIGKVVLVIPNLGAAITYLGANIHIVFIFLAICILASFGIRGVFAKSRGKKEVKENDV